MMPVQRLQRAGPMVDLGSRARPPSPFLPGILSAALAAALTLAVAAPAAAAPARADRFGVYHWGADFSAWPGAPDRLTWGADQVAALGSRTIRVFLGAGDVYGVDAEPNPDDADFLRRIAQGPAYAALFADPRFRTYLLTVYPPGAFVAWRDGFDAAEAALEHAQVARLGERLLADPAHAGKTFIVLNLREALAAADSLGVAHAIVWQALDNRWRVEDGATRSLTSCRAPDWSLYGLFRGLDGGRTLLGAVFGSWLAGEGAAVPAPAACPSIAPAGVRGSGARGRGRIDAGGRLAVAGSGFSPAGNRLRILQAHLLADDEPDVPNEHLTLHAAAARSWRESPQRIEASLPAGALHDGCALVYVTNAAGTDSNAVLVRVRAARTRSEPRPRPRPRP